MAASATDWIDELGSVWRREYRHLDTGALPPLVRLARLSLLIDSLQTEVLRPFDLARGDYGVLAMLRRAGSPYELSPSQLTNRLARSSGGMTKILKRLEEAGLVRRLPDPDDGRGSRDCSGGGPSPGRLPPLGGGRSAPTNKLTRRCSSPPSTHTTRIAATCRCRRRA